MGSSDKFRCYGSPNEEWLCPCDLGEVDCIIHYVLYCPLYRSLSEALWSTYLAKLASWPGTFQLIYLLRDTDKHVTHKIVLFAVGVAKNYPQVHSMHW